MTGVLIRGKDTRDVQRKGHMKTPQEGGHLQAKEEGLRRIQIFQQLILDLQPSELWENKFLLFKLKKKRA